mgnify:CR=1 FL=1
MMNLYKSIIFICAFPRFYWLGRAFGSRFFAQQKELHNTSIPNADSAR